MSAGPAPKAAPRPRHRHHHRVCVVELDDCVWNEPRFRKANPDHQLGRPFVYVGMTGLDPDLRFDKHKAGIPANRFVLECACACLSSCLRSVSCSLGQPLATVREPVLRPNPKRRTLR